MSGQSEQQGIDAVFDDHMAAEFERRDVEATMQTMTSNPYLTQLPVLTGGYGYEEVERFYRRHFIGKWPADTSIQPVSRTVSRDQVVDELVLSFTHDVEMDHFLPGVPPTGRRVRVPVCVVVKFEDRKVAHEHIYWDHASVLVQVGLLDRASLPVTGAEQADKLLDPSLPSNALMERWAESESRR